MCSLPAVAGEWEYRWSTDFKHKFDNRLTAKLEIEYRYASSLEGNFYRHTDVGLERKCSPSFAMSLNLRKIVEQAKGLAFWEDRPYVNGTFKWNWGNMEFSDRNRFECRSFSTGESNWRYRNSLKITFLPRERTAVQIVPFVIDEVFYDLSRGEFNRNRLYLGLESLSQKDLNWEVSYLMQNSKAPSQWKEVNALVTRLHIRF
ncbi:MAG: DUF2490 domain-containing protein [Candidatus Eremiobacteraeota bacterium]|nr:DUF2490 domain-containing protein [Candidatus Eremiobacteraeota bacterium]